MLPQRANAPVTLTLSNPHAQASAVLQVFVGTRQTWSEGRVPIAGRYARDGGVLTFSPAFGLVPMTDYVVRIRSGEEDEWVPFQVPAKAAPTEAVLTHVFPSADVLPENTLRFYLHFSVPMASHVALDHIALRDASGAVDDAAFMRFKQELWSEDRTRLTVLMDPGRIKRAVAANAALGPALRTGQAYELTVSAGWPCADGTAALTAFSKSFTVSPPLRQRPDILHWHASSPRTGTRQALDVALDRPFDRHRLPTSVKVVSPSGKRVRGTIEVGLDERSWRFVPDEPWAAHDLQVVVDPTLEDVAGNNFYELLDAAAGEGAPAQVHTSLPVVVRS